MPVIKRCGEVEISANLPTLFFETPSAWEAWLEANHTSAKGVWLKIAKKETGITSVDYAQALEGALCYGWIDGQKAALDDSYWLQKFTPRGPKSGWSKVNCGKAEVLIAQGRMKPAGLQQVALAKADGRWDAAYASQSKIEVPEDFQHALDQHPAAQEFFNSLNSANRYAFLYRIETAKKPETRAARIEKFVAMLENRQKFH